jgi:hypothetical protein
MDHYPEWLGRDPVAGALLWEQGLPSSLERAEVKLRDSGVASLLHAPNVRMLCLVRDRTLLTLPVPAETI